RTVPARVERGEIARGRVAVDADPVGEAGVAYLLDAGAVLVAPEAVGLGGRRREAEHRPRGQRALARGGFPVSARAETAQDRVEGRRGVAGSEDGRVGAPPPV